MKKYIKVKRDAELKVDDLLLKDRRLFLFNEVKSESMERLIRQLYILDALNSKPIFLYINSPGGSVSDGFALINTIKMIDAPVVTVINGEACSMGGLISIAGKKRFMTKNSFWMAHDMRGGIWGDYSAKIEHRAVFLGRVWKSIEKHLRDHTRLNDKQIALARNGELWLDEKECLRYGVIDKII